MKSKNAERYCLVESEGMAVGLGFQGKPKDSNTYVKPNLLFAIVFYYLATIGFIGVLASAYIIATETRSSPKSIVAFLFVLVISAWLLFYSLAFIRGCRIHLISDRLIIRNWSNGFSYVHFEAVLKDLRPPKSEEMTFDIQNTELIVYGSLNFIEKYCKAIGDNAFLKRARRYKRNKKKGFMTLKWIIPSDYLYIRVKNSDSAQIVFLGLYPAKKVGWLIDQLNKRGVQIIKQ